MKTLRAFMIVLHFFKSYSVYAKTMRTDTLENTVSCAWWAGRFVTKKIVRNRFQTGAHIDYYMLRA